MFKFLQDRIHRKNQASAMYEAAVEQSRQPEFYAALNVPDNVDGRFEMMTLHCGTAEI